MRRSLRLFVCTALLCLGLALPKQELSAQNKEQKVGAVICNVLSSQKNFPTPRFPLIKLNSDEVLKVEFDLLDQEDKILNYRLVHCNSDWTKSNLQPIEYVDGFAEYSLETAEYSNATLQSYLHYQLHLSNETTRIKHSGNYRIEILDTDSEDDEVLLSIPFAVYEEDSQIEAEVLERNYMNNSREAQQINLSINLPNEDIQRASQETKVVILQNGRWNNAVVLKKPSSYQGNTLEYRDFNAGVFQGGNEYHKLEHLYDKGTGLGVFKQDLWAGRYRLELYPQKNRSREAYIYEKDQNGRSYIRSMETDFPETEADYHWVDFSFISPKLEGGDVFIEGEYFDYLPLSQRKMTYNEEKEAYELRLLVKEGYQEYQFLFLPYGSKQMISSQTEGNHYQTTNDYQVLVYRKKASDRAERLIAYKELFTK